MDRQTPRDDRPLCVDLDGTLLATDSLHELALAFARERPLELWRLPAWLRAGRAALKRALTRRVSLSPARLPYRPEVVELLAAERARGRPVVLVTAADRPVAEAIAAELGLFDEVLASDGRRNLKGPAKAEALCARFGEGGFEYLGDAWADLPVWRAAGGASLVSAGRRLRARAATQGPVLRELAPRPGPGARARAWAALLGVARWPFQLWVAAPALWAAGLGQQPAWGGVLAATLAFCALGSALGIGGQLARLDADRAAAVPGRPVASGALSILAALVAAAASGMSALLAGLLASPLVVPLLGVEVLRALGAGTAAGRPRLGLFLLAAGVAVRVGAGAVAR